MYVLYRYTVEALKFSWIKLYTLTTAYVIVNKFQKRKQVLGYQTKVSAEWKGEESCLTQQLMWAPLFTTRTKSLHASQAKNVKYFHARSSLSQYFNGENSEWVCLIIELIDPEQVFVCLFAKAQLW